MVEWGIPIPVGDALDFSGRMQVRVSDVGGTATRQRQVEAPQVRSVQTPLWLDDRWAAFSYNIQKNFNGIVYLDTEAGTLLQLEMVAPVRRMGATGRFEAELTSLDVAEHGTTETAVHRNITRGRSSVFPVVIRTFPPFDGRPYPHPFPAELSEALGAYRTWMAANSMTDMEIETGSEAFSPDERHVALLAYLDTESDGVTTSVASLIIAPVDGTSPQEVFSAAKLLRLDPAVRLSCVTQLAYDDADAGMMAPDLVRYTARWQDSRTVAVDREIADEERDEIRTEPVYLATLDGETTRLPALDKPPPQPVSGRMHKDDEISGDEDDDEAEITVRERRPNRPVRVNTSPGEASPRRTLSATPGPNVTPQPRRTPSAAGERRIPAVSAPGTPGGPARHATPTPYTAEPIPSLLQRIGGTLRLSSGSKSEDQPGPATPAPAPTPAQPDAAATRR